MGLGQDQQQYPAYTGIQCHLPKVGLQSEIGLCILGELAGGGSVAVAVGASDV